MNELRRQAWLKQMGFTPWVALRPLPHAAVAPRLAWPEPVAVADGEPAVAAAVVPSPASSATRAGVPRREADRAVPSSGVTDAAPAPTPAAGDEPGLRCTFQACQAGAIWVVAAQGEADLPDFTPPEQQLFRALVQALRARPGRVRRFEWPLAPAAGDAAEAPLWFQGCLEMIAGPGGRVLLCAPEALVTTLLGVDRYREQAVAGARLLAVSSLTEMLQDPVEHKRRSWQAMVRAGFHA